jgi:hypothetical protein
MIDSEGAAFSLDAELRTGYTKGIRLFRNPALSPHTDADGRFDAVNVEVWGFGGPPSLR